MVLNKALMLLKVKRERTESLLSIFKNIEGVVAGGLTIGPYDYILFLQGNDWDNLFDVVKNIKSVDGVDVSITLPVHRGYGFTPSTVSAFVLTRIIAGDVDELCRRIYDGKFINFSASVAGPYDIVLCITEKEIRSMADISNIVIDRIQSFQEIRETLTLTTGNGFYFKK